jgi:hypothetical protein
MSDDDDLGRVRELLARRSSRVRRAPPRSARGRRGRTAPAAVRTGTGLVVGRLRGREGIDAEVIERLSLPWKARGHYHEDGSRPSASPWLGQRGGQSPPFRNRGNSPSRMSHEEIVRIIQSGGDGAHGPRRGARTRPLRRRLLPRLAPSCLRRHLLLCLVDAERMRAFPPRPEGRVPTIRSASRPERHFADSFITFRLALARALVRCLPRCPLCHECRRPSTRLNCRAR